MTARIVIDWTRCDAHGLCAELLPEVVGLDDWGYPVLEDGGHVAENLGEYAAHAVRACPQLALLLTSGAAVAPDGGRTTRPPG